MYITDCIIVEFFYNAPKKTLDKGIVVVNNRKKFVKSRFGRQEGYGANGVSTSEENKVQKVSLIYTNFLFTNG
jgi:hypothetical protein